MPHDCKMSKFLDVWLRYAFSVKGTTEVKSDTVFKSLFCNSSMVGGEFSATRVISLRYRLTRTSRTDRDKF